MNWKCPNCGFEHNEEGSRVCEGGCGYLRIPPRVALLAAATGQRLLVGIDTSVGKYMLKGVVGSEHIYAGDPQFRLRRSRELVGWAIEHASGARNPTFLNGAPVGPEPRLLEAGSVISIGPLRARMTVEFAD